MSDRTPDTEIAIKITRSTDPDTYEWIAKSKTKPKILGSGDTPEDALDRFVDDLRQEVDHPETISHEIHGVTATVRIYVPENHPLSDFGVGAQHDATEIPALPGPSKQYPSKQYPIADYTNGIPEALALMAMLTVDCGGPIVLEEAEAQCSKYTDAAGIPLTLDSVQQKYPDFVEKFEESTNKINGDVEFAWVVEFRPSTYAGTDIYDGNSFWKAMKKAIDPTPEDAVDEEEGTPSSETCGKCRYFSNPISPFDSNCEELDAPTSEGDEACKYFEPRVRDDIMARAEAGDFVFGVSLSADEIDAISRGAKTWLIVPANTIRAPQSGGRILTYEKGKRRAFTGRFIVGEVKILERDVAVDGEWQTRLNMSENDIVGRLGTSFRVTAIEICDYCEFCVPYPVPEEEKAPRGMTWLSPMYLKVLLNPFGTVPKVEEAKE